MRSRVKVVKRVGTSKAEAIKGWKPCSRLMRSCWKFKHQVLVHEWVERGAAELSVRVKLLIYQLIYIPPLTYDHKMWVVT